MLVVPCPLSVLSSSYAFFSSKPRFCTYAPSPLTTALLHAFPFYFIIIFLLHIFKGKSWGENWCGDMIILPVNQTSSEIHHRFRHFFSNKASIPLYLLDISAAYMPAASFLSFSLHYYYHMCRYASIIFLPQ